MRKLPFLLLSLFLLLVLNSDLHAYAYVPGGCGTGCWAQINNFCPTCNPWNYNPMMQQQTPWYTPYPWWWRTGPMMYGNFYQPAPWIYAGTYPGVMNYYPGGGTMYAAKPNLYLEGPAGTEVNLKLKFTEEGANWLAAVPIHGRDGWKGKLIENNRIQTEQGTHKFLYSDYRMHGRQFQDQAGFCADKSKIVGKLALTLKQSGFNGREIADFLDYWSVKFPQSKRYCVYPQDERQLDTVAVLEMEPKPSAVRRLLFMVQVEEGLIRNGGKFTAPPKKDWSPQPLRIPASAEKAVMVREWGVGFFAAKP